MLIVAGRTRQLETVCLLTIRRRNPCQYPGGKSLFARIPIERQCSLGRTFEAWLIVLYSPRFGVRGRVSLSPNTRHIVNTNRSCWEWVSFSEARRV
jgi:hypothetical protein